MSSVRVKRFLERKYSGGYYNFWTDVSVQELIDAGVKVYWHVNMYTPGRMGYRCADLEETRWRLARSEEELDSRDGAMVERDDGFYEYRVMIYFDIKDDDTWRGLQHLEKVNEEREAEYWRMYRESGKAEQAAIERGWALRGSDSQWYDRQIAPEAQLC